MNNQIIRYLSFALGAENVQASWCLLLLWPPHLKENHDQNEIYRNLKLFISVKTIKPHSGTAVSDIMLFTWNAFSPSPAKPPESGQDELRCHEEAQIASEESTWFPSLTGCLRESDPIPSDAAAEAPSSRAAVNVIISAHLSGGPQCLHSARVVSACTKRLSRLLWSSTVHLMRPCDCYPNAWKINVTHFFPNTPKHDN